jgi:hypothetical protein
MGLISAVARRLFPPTETIDGYEQPELIEIIFRKTLAYEPKGDWPEMQGVSSVLDFGGGCGLHYKQAKSSTARWAVVETPAMVERAKELATEKLQFFANISDAARWLGGVEKVHSNGSLQYAPDPERALEQLCAVRAKKMHWDRTALSKNGFARETQSSLLGDNGPGPSPPIREKSVRYTMTRIPEQTFLDAHRDYTIDARGPDWFRFSLKC